MTRPHQWSISMLLIVASVALMGGLFDARTGRGVDAQVVNPPEGPLAIDSVDDFAVFVNVLGEPTVRRRVEKELQSDPCSWLEFGRLRWSPFQPETYATNLEFGVPATTRVVVGYVRDPLVTPPTTPPDTILSSTMTIPLAQQKRARHPLFTTQLEYDFLVYVLTDQGAALTAPLVNSRRLQNVGVELISTTPTRSILLSWFEYADAQGNVTTITVSGDYFSPSSFVVTSVK